MIYIALLRGINVNGHQKISMADLKETFESLDFKNIITFGNSGNVIFSHSSTNRVLITRKIEKRIQRAFILDIKVFLRSAQDIFEVCNNIPLNWKSEKGIMTHIIFLSQEIDSPDILNQVKIDSHVDKVKYLSGAVLWNASMKNLSKSTVYKLFSTKLTKQVTIRSVNPMRKINQIISQLPKA